MENHIPFCIATNRGRPLSFYKNRWGFHVFSHRRLILQILDFGSERVWDFGTSLALWILTCLRPFPFCKLQMLYFKNGFYCTQFVKRLYDTVLIGPKLQSMVHGLSLKKDEFTTEWSLKLTTTAIIHHYT